MISWLIVRLDKPRLSVLIYVVVACVVLAACATHDGYEKKFDGTLEPYGFFSGMWHGLIWPIVFGFFLVVKFIAFVVWAGIWLYSYFGNLFWDQHNALPHYVSVGDSIKLVGQPNSGFGYWIGYLIGLSESLGSSGGVASTQTNRH